MARSARADLIRSTALNRGILGNSRVWALVAVSIYGVRLLRWMARRETQVVGIEDLEAGEAVLIRAIPASEARRLAKSERRARRRT